MLTQLLLLHVNLHSLDPFVITVMTFSSFKKPADRMGDQLSPGALNVKFGQ